MLQDFREGWGLATPKSKNLELEATVENGSCAARIVFHLHGKRAVKKKKRLIFKEDFAIELHKEFSLF